MANVRKLPEEAWLPFYRRRHRRARDFHTGELPTLWLTAAGSVFGWFGHVRRHPDGPPSRAAAWRSLGWWRAVQCVRSARDPAGRHSRSNWTRDAEHVFERCFGENFSNLPLNREAWSERKAHFQRWCCATLGGSPPAYPVPPKRARRALEAP